VLQLSRVARAVGAGDKGGGDVPLTEGVLASPSTPPVIQAAALPQRAFQAPSIINCGDFVFTLSPAL